MERTEKDCLIDLLIDIDSPEFTKIKQQANVINIFDVLKITHTEIRHSNLLAWLLDPNENHQLGSVFGKYFFHEVYDSIDVDEIHFHFSKLFLESIDNFIVYRERFNIDILLVADNQLVCIENKIDSFTHSEQLVKYEKILHREFPKHEILFLYLTPNEEDISKYPNWHKISYQTVNNAIQKIIDTTTLNTTTQILITDYQNIIKGEIMKEENEIKKLCLDIYKKHKTALDLIFNYRPDDDLAISEAIIGYLQSRQDIIYDGFNYGKTILRFTTQTMRELFPNATPNPKSPWPNGYAFMYEINLSNGKISAVFTHPIYNEQKEQSNSEQKMQLVFNYTQKNNLKLGIIKKHKYKDDWKIYTALNKVIFEQENFNGSTEELIDAIKNEVTKFIENDLKKFENDLCSLLHQDNNSEDYKK